MNSNGTGVDVGTNMIVVATVDENNNSVFRMQRDAFYRIKPKSEVNKSSIRMSLEKRGCNFIVDGHDFIACGESALEIAIERNDKAQRPLSKGVISPKEKDSLPMLKHLLEEVVGRSDGGSLVYSIPASPIDASYDIVYHTSMLDNFFTSLGYVPNPLNEGFAIALSELLDEGLSGITMSFGAGMCNVCVCIQGDPLVEFSTTKSGDFIDLSVGNALDISPSLVQLEKESGLSLLTNLSNNKIHEAVAVYYMTVINYTLRSIAYELSQRRDLPNFREKIPIVVSGGLTLAEGFVEKFNQCLNNVKLPFEISEVRRASNAMQAVAAGCLLASQL
jgi:hypothetical protein